MGERLERASTGRARCKSCNELIEKGALRMGVSGDSGSFDGNMTIWHHALCAAIRNPAGMLRASATSNELPKSVREPLEMIANTIRARKLKQVVWRHPSETRCLLELADEHYALFASVDGKLVVARGPLDEVIASVPDEDLEVVVDTAIAAGKVLARGAR